MVKIEHLKAPSTRIRIFLNPQFFLCRFGFQPHVSGESQKRIRNFLNPLWIQNCMNAQSGYFCIRWCNKIQPSSLPWILYSRWQLRSQVLSLTRLYDACSVANRLNPAFRPTCRIRVEGQIRFENRYVWKQKSLNLERKSCEFKKYPDTCGRGLRALPLVLSG